MKTEILLTETEIAREFSEALDARDLPEKFFYWSPLSVSAWKAMSGDGAFESARQVWNAVVERASRIGAMFEKDFAVISLGAGDGAKDVALLRALPTTRRVEYFPVDASQPLLEQACEAAEDAEVDTLGIKADISSPTHLLLAADATERPRLYLMAGNTLGGFDPLEQVRHLAGAMRPPDRLIVDAEVQGPEPPDNALATAFVLAPLESAGVSGEDGEVRFEIKSDERRDGLHLVTRWFQASHDLDIRLPDRQILLERGERVSLNFRYTYSRDAFRWLLKQHGGLKILDEIGSADGRYVTAVCSR